MFKLLFLVVVTFVTAAYSQNLQTCFKRFGNCDIIYSQPYQKVWRVDNATCLQQCSADQPNCKAVVYDTAFSICNLYSFTGNSGPGFLIPAYQKVYYQFDNSSCSAAITGVPLPETATASVPQAPVTGPTAPALTPGTAPATVPGPTLETAPTIPTQSPNLLLDTTLSTAAVTIPTLPAVSARALVNLAKPTKPKKSSPGCENGKQPVYLGLMETSVATPPDLLDGPTASNVGDPSPCIKACSLNQDPTGKAIDCQSFTYNSVNQKCTFHPFAPIPDGPAETSNVVGINTFVKSCISVTQENTKCKNAMLVTASGVELTGHVRKSLNGIKSLVECLDECLTDETCESFNYYHKSRQCTLHDSDSVAAPDGIGAAKSEDAIYVENTCGGAGRRQAHVDREDVNRFETKIPPEPDQTRVNVPKKEKSSRQKTARGDASGDDETKFTSWGKWTECMKRTHGSSVRIRVRACKADNLVCRGKKAEYEKCDS